MRGLPSNFIRGLRRGISVSDCWLSLNWRQQRRQQARSRHLPLGASLSSAFTDRHWSAGRGRTGGNHGTPHRGVLFTFELRGSIVICV